MVCLTAEKWLGMAIEQRVIIFRKTKIDIPLSYISSSSPLQIPLFSSSAGNRSTLSTKSLCLLL